MTKQSDLSIDEIQILIESLKAWEKQPISDEMFGSMLGAMFMGMSPKEDREAEKKSFHERETKKLDMAQKKGEVRRDQSIMLQAKLLVMRNSILNGE